MLCVLFVLNLLYSFTLSVHPNWGSSECDATITGRFLEGSPFYNVIRWYTLTLEYPTSIERDIIISTCVRYRPQNVHDRPLAVSVSSNYLYDLDGDTAEYVDSLSSCPDDADGNDQWGYIYTFTDVPAGTYLLPVLNNMDGLYEGGAYSVSIECYNPPTPSPIEPIDYSNRTDFTYQQDWTDGGVLDISCGQHVYGTTPTDGSAWYRYTVLSFATEIHFNSDSSSNHYLRAYWFVDQQYNRHWRNETDGFNNNNEIEIDDRSSNWRLTPGYYYIRIDPNEPFFSGTIDYTLEMECWDDDTVQEATNNMEWTESPTPNPSPAPTTLNPTYVNITLSPTPGPTQLYNPNDLNNPDKKYHNLGDIGCGIYHHGELKQHDTDYYTFEVVDTSLQYFSFDTCMNDQTQFYHCIALYSYQHATWDDWRTYFSPTCNTRYCNSINSGSSLPLGKYLIAIWGNEGAGNPYKGEYILRMGCDPDNYDAVTTVDSTLIPTPSPTGNMEFEPRDDKLIGSITCGVTVVDELKKKEGHFHKFEVTETIDWVEFSTCDDTEFENYLFVYYHVNYTNGEEWTYSRDNSLGFHYEDNSHCNKITMNDLNPGLYYVYIEGYNYYFDYGEYTIRMTCSDNGAVANTSNYNEYSSGMPVWAIIVLVIGILLFIAIIVLIIFCCKKRSSSGGGGGGNNEMANRSSNNNDGEYVN